MTVEVNTVLLTKEMKKITANFESGNIFLDEFIRSEDAFDDGLGKTFVWIDETRKKLIGYYNVGVGYIDMYSGEEKYKVGGAIHLNFFALDKDYRGIVVDINRNGMKKKLSDRLFADFMRKVMEIRNKYLGFSFITLAATEEGYSLYKRFCFEDLDTGLHFSFKNDEKGCTQMYFALDA